MSDVTQLLEAAAAGDTQAADRLLPLVYDELRKLAAAKMLHEKPGQTLDSTALVHEAYLRLAGGGPDPPGFANRAHFFAAAAEAMRRILIENARRKRRDKRGGGRQRVDLDAVAPEADGPALDVLALDEALGQLAAEDARKASLVRLRYFAGLSLEEAAECLGVSRATASREWAYARAWLYDRLGGGGSENP
jgi:RNA polymerase sigma factor (TIGR02999 family)